MRRYLIAYGATLVVMLVVDFGWLSLMGARLYRPRLGDLMLAQPVLWPAAIFYLVYVVGVVVLAELPGLRSASWVTATIHGALLGCVAYATYDLTNQATLRNWSGLITVCDIAWGTLLTAIAATAGYTAAQRWG